MTDRARPDPSQEPERLNALLTWLLTAVSQQFTHMLLLRKRGQTDMVARLKEVDDVDFPNAMRIIDLLFRAGTPISIAQHVVAPANSTHAILETELAFERDFDAFLQSLDNRSPEGQERLAKARAPRGPYRTWLAEALHQTPAGSCAPASERRGSRLFSILLRLMEQTLVHAFANWHVGRSAEASTSWQISGAAMLYLTALAEFCGSDDQAARGIEVPGSTVVDTDVQFDADIELVRQSALEARLLAENTENRELVRVCLSVAKDCDLVARSTEGEPIQAELGRSGVFRDFQNARHRMNR